MFVPAPLHPREAPTRHRTHDYIHHYHGYWRPGGLCRIQIFEAEGQPPVIICSELLENENT
jgi:hypothetical protein